MTQKGELDLASLHVYHEVISYQGILVVLVLFRRKNILQKTNHGKTVQERSRISLSLTTTRLAQTLTPQLSPMKNNNTLRVVSDQCTSCGEFSLQPAHL